MYFKSKLSKVWERILDAYHIKMLMWLCISKKDTNMLVDVSLVQLQAMNFVKARVNLEHYVRCDLAYFGPRSSIFWYMRQSFTFYACCRKSILRRIIPGNKLTIFYHLKLRESNEIDLISPWAVIDENETHSLLQLLALCNCARFSDWNGLFLGSFL